MGFFDFLKSKSSKNYTDEIISDDWLDDLYSGYLPNDIQATMYKQARNIHFFANTAARDPNRQNIEKMKNAHLVSMKAAKAVEDILAYNGVTDIKAEHLAAAFYLVNLGDITLRDATSFSDAEIKNTVATDLIGLGYDNIKPNQIPQITVYKVRETVKWLLAHPTE